MNEIQKIKHEGAKITKMHKDAEFLLILCEPSRLCVFVLNFVNECGGSCEAR